MRTSSVEVAEQERLFENPKLRDLAELVRANPEAAAAALRNFVDEHPLDARGYRLFAAARTSVAERTGGRETVGLSPAKARMGQAAQALQEGDLETAEIIVRARLLEQPDDAEALRMMADLAIRLGFHGSAENLLRYALELAPDFAIAKIDLARHLQLENQYDEALQLLDDVLASEPGNERALYMKAIVLGHAGRFEPMVEIYEGLLKQSPRRARLWASYGRSLKTVGRSKESVDALRRATELDPALGEAWWSLSDLKTVRLGDEDIATMEAALRREHLPENERWYLHFALGKAFEDQREFEKSFAHYAKGNALRRPHVDHDPDRFTNYVSEAIRTFTPEFFAERSGFGDPSADPIFILGMTRAGSTLIEQILSSHPQIEGTMELPQMLAIARRLSDQLEGRVAAVATLDGDEAAALGQRYLRETRGYRKLGRPHFIDKMPNNWLYVPLIRLLLPNAKIIDARRHPLACCFSNFKQNYARGQAFSYDQADAGRFYSDYVRMMTHIDSVLPGKVHRVYHERLVDDTEGEVRRLLDYLGLPFHEDCLQFHKNERAVRTASAEQVRRPINRQGVEQWKWFEPWLGPLKKALGPVLDAYPDSPF